MRKKQKSEMTPPELHATKASLGGFPELSPHGTKSHTNSKVNELVCRFKAGIKKSAETILEACEALYSAHRELEGDELAAFYKAIGYSEDNTKIRKLWRIGECSTKVRPYLVRLPRCWTTLYQLIKLEDDDFKNLMNSGAVHPLVTWDDLKVALGKDESFRRSFDSAVKDLGGRLPDRVGDRPAAPPP